MHQDASWLVPEEARVMHQGCGGSVASWWYRVGWRILAVVILLLIGYYSPANEPVLQIQFLARNVAKG
jgi:hypothetical protein